MKVLCLNYAEKREIKMEKRERDGRNVPIGHKKCPYIETYKTSTKKVLFPFLFEITKNMKVLCLNYAEKRE
jgi:hypothetical protein